MSNGVEENSKESGWILLSIHHSLLSNFKNGWPPPLPSSLMLLKRKGREENKMMQLKKWKQEEPYFPRFSPIYVHFLIGFYAWPNPKWEGQRCIIVVKAFSQCEKEAKKKDGTGQKKVLLLPEVVVVKQKNSFSRGAVGDCNWLRNLCVNEESLAREIDFDTRLGTKRESQEGAKSKDSSYLKKQAERFFSRCHKYLRNIPLLLNGSPHHQSPKNQKEEGEEEKHFGDLIIRITKKALWELFAWFVSCFLYLCSNEP